MGEPERPSVLVVEDDPGLRLALEAGLAAEGFAVEAVGDAGSACDRAGPDVVLLDWTLAEGDTGPSACRRVCGPHPPARGGLITRRSHAPPQPAALHARRPALLVQGL